MPSDICSSGQPPGKLSQLLYKLLLSCYVQLRTASRASLAMLSSSSSVMLSRVMATFSWDRRILSLFLMMVETCLVIRKIFIVTGVGSSAVCLRLLGMISVTPHLYPRPPFPPFSSSTDQVTPPHWAQCHHILLITVESAHLSLLFIESINIHEKEEMYLTQDTSLVAVESGYCLLKGSLCFHEKEEMSLIRDTYHHI